MDLTPFADSQLTDSRLLDGGSAADLPKPQPPELSCSAPQVIPGSDLLYEPAIRADGLTLLASVLGEPGWRATTRDTLEAPWGSWSELSPPPDLGEDLMFFRAPTGKIEQAITVRVSTNGGRYLELCDADVVSCQRISVTNPFGALITEDLDGPKLAWIAAGNVSSWQMVLNVQPGDDSTVDIWLAEPSGVDLLFWQARPLDELNLPDVKDDDPALSPDGRAIVFSRSTITMKRTLYVATRNDPSEPFSTPKPLTALNSGQGDCDLVFFPRPSGELEVYFFSYRFIEPQLMGAVCELKDSSS